MFGFPRKRKNVNNSIETATQASVEDLVDCHIRYEKPIIGALSGKLKEIRTIVGKVHSIRYDKCPVSGIEQAPIAVISYNKDGITMLDYILASWLYHEGEVLQ